MNLRDLIKEVINEEFSYDQIDRESSPGLSPCVVKYILEERLTHVGGDTITSDTAFIRRYLSGEGYTAAELESVQPQTRWLCTLYPALPDCSRTPWGEVDLQKRLLLLRGGVQRLNWNGLFSPPKPLG